MSLIINQKDNVIAYIVDTRKKKNSQVATLSYDENGEIGCDEIELESGFKFELAPRPLSEKERTTHFIAGESGSGKSYFAREFAKRYKSMFPKNDIYLISYLEKDETIDEYKEIIRINAITKEFLDECMDLDLEVEFKHSMVIFDDIDSIVNKKTKEKIYGLLNKMLRLGRHHNITVLYLGHELYNSPELKHILNESMTITFFPKHLNYKKMKYLLEVYFGLSPEQIEKIRSIRDRSITYMKGHDKIILSDSTCFILN